MQEEFNFFPSDRLNRLIDLFHQQFLDSHKTHLCGGGSEPLYQPGEAGEYHKIVFTRDYFSSALHEIAHWCIAGDGRRRMTDYGYWYAPDGRSDEQQFEFEQVEVKPQAVERIFSHACAQPFRVSADNLNGGIGVSRKFIDAIQKQTIIYCREGLPVRANKLVKALAKGFDQPNPLSENNYWLEQLV